MIFAPFPSTGVFNSSKTTGSMSDADLTDDGGEGRVGAFDYFHRPPETKPTPTYSYGEHLPFDLRPKVSIGVVIFCFGCSIS